MKKLLNQSSISKMSFVDKLLQKYQDKVQKSSSHPLTNELCNGTLPDYKLYTYLVQDLKFFQLGLQMLGSSLSHCDNAESSIVLAKQIGFFANDENTYFQRCLAQLRAEAQDQIHHHVPAMEKEFAPTLPQVLQYLQFIAHLTHDALSYGEIITCVYVMEVVYLIWAELHSNSKDTVALEYKHQEWVDLHRGPAFSAWVQFLAGEVNRAAGTNLQEKMEQIFEKTLDHEIAFFDACYQYEE